MKKSKLFMIALVVVLTAGVVSAQTATGTTTIRATKAESISVSAGTLADFDLLALVSHTLNITSYWNLTPARNSVTVCAYMNPATGRMSGTAGNSNVIDETMVQTKVGAGSWANINAGTGCGVGTGVTVVKTYALTNNTSRNVSSSSPNSDNVDVQLNGVPSTYEADTYTGTLTVVAYAQ